VERPAALRLELEKDLATVEDKDRQEADADEEDRVEHRDEGRWAEPGGQQTIEELLEVLTNRRLSGHGDGIEHDGEELREDISGDRVAAEDQPRGKTLAQLENAIDRPVEMPVLKSTKELVQSLLLSGKIGAQRRPQTVSTTPATKRTRALRIAVCPVGTVFWKPDCSQDAARMPKSVLAYDGSVPRRPSGS
jgi:hypothetical protein